MRGALAVILLCLAPGWLAGAEIAVVGSGTLTVEQVEAGTCSVRLTGQIKAGDADRLRVLLEQRFSRDYDNLSASVCLDSPGGALDEAVRLAEVLGSLDASAVVPAGAECLSACAVAFMGGTFGFFEEAYNMRVMHPTARVGFHAPALSISEGSYDRRSVERAFDIAVDAVARIAGDMDVRLPTSHANRFPRSLLAQMLVHRGEDFLWIDTVEKAGAWDIRLITDRQPALEPQALVKVCKAAERWMEDRPKMAFAPDDWELWGDGTVTGSGDNWTVTYGGLLIVQCRVDRREGGELALTLVREGTELGQIVLRPFLAFGADTPLRELR